MIKITGAEVRDGYFTEASGHADYAPYGSDIVCAGVSALLLTAVNMLEKAQSEGLGHFRTKSMSDGYLCFDFKPKNTEYARQYVGIILDYLANGLTLIEEAYPENVSADI